MTTGRYSTESGKINPKDADYCTTRKHHNNGRGDKNGNSKSVSSAGKNMITKGVIQRRLNPY